MTPIIEVVNLSKIYKVHKRKPGLANTIKDFFVRKYQFVNALNNITFNIAEGELVAYIGPNGAGKTTTLKILSGILYPSDGNVKVMGFIPQQRKKEFLTNIAFIMGQKSQIWWDIPSMDTFLLNKEIYGIPTAVFNERLEELVEMLKVKDLIYIPAKKLSLGERMKMEIIASLLHAPKILFLDEPTIGLDILSQDSIRKFLIEYNKKHKATILLTSHYIKDIEIICNRIIILNNGKIIFDGDKSEVLNKFLQERVVKVKFKHPIIDFSDLDYLVSQDEEYYKFKVPTDNVKMLIEQLSKYGDIEEVLIEELELEDAIKIAFQNEKVS